MSDIVARADTRAIHVAIEKEKAQLARSIRAAVAAVVAKIAAKKKLNPLELMLADVLNQLARYKLINDNVVVAAYLQCNEPLRSNRTSIRAKPTKRKK
jgi:hypothetical protein